MSTKKTNIKSAVESASKGLDTWGTMTPSKRGALLYDYSQLLEKEASSIVAMTSTKKVREVIEKELSRSIERIFWYAGWCDKLPQVYSSINPVPTNHVSITSLEPMGVIGILSPRNQKLLGAMTALLPIIVSGNTAVVVIESQKECEVMKRVIGLMEEAGLPKGVVEVVFGDQKKLGKELATCDEISGIAIHTEEKSLIRCVRVEACKTIKYMEVYDDSSRRDLFADKYQTPYRILPFVEFKTTWHPVTALGAA